MKPNHLFRSLCARFRHGALILATLYSTTSGQAAKPAIVNAEDLDLNLPCIGRVDITVDPSMSDGVSLDSATTNGAHVTIRTSKTQGSSRVLIASKSCAPSTKVSILVAPNVGVLIHDSHDSHFVINGKLASLEASLEAGQLDADTIQSLDLSLRGTEQVHITHLNRAAQVVENGNANLVIDHANLDAFSAQVSETSHLTIADGRFDVLTLVINNAASVHISGAANTATVAANGTGSVTIPQVKGALTHTGTIQVGPETETAQTPMPPSTSAPNASLAASNPATSNDATSNDATSNDASPSRHPTPLAKTDKTTQGPDSTPTAPKAPTAPATQQQTPQMPPTEHNPMVPMTLPHSDGQVPQNIAPKDAAPTAVPNTAQDKGKE